MSKAAALYLIDTGDDYIETTCRPADDEWVTSATAASILCFAPAGFTTAFRPGNNYWEVRRILRGSRGKLSARGQGHLFNAKDLQRIMAIRRAVRCQTRTAAKIFAAQKLGRL